MRMIKFGFGLLLSMLVVSFPVAAEAPYRIGVVYDISGVGSVTGQGIRNAVELAIAERGGKVGGREIEVVWENDQSKSQVSVQKVTRLLASKIDLLIGPSQSGSVLAVMSLVAQAKVPHLVTASGDERITGTNKTRYTFRTSAPFSQDNLLISNLLKSGATKKVYGVVGDTAVLRDSYAKIRSGITKGGIQIVGEDYTPFDTKDWSILIDKISRSDADTVLFVTAGTNSIGFLKQAYEVGLTRKVKIVGPILADDISAKAIGPGIEGVVSTLRYHASLDNPANKRFVQAYRQRYGVDPDMFAGDAYDALSWWLDTVQRVGGTDKEKFIDAFRIDTRITSVKGTKKMRSCDNQAEQIGLIGVGARKSPAGSEFGMSILQVSPASSAFFPCP